jgi:hypothetical protein
MKFTSRPLIVLALLISFGNAALAGNTADFGILRVSPATSTVSAQAFGQ